mgnify:CR=1 FL=1
MSCGNDVMKPLEASSCLTPKDTEVPSRRQIMRATGYLMAAQSLVRAFA